jgi:hypothetical protein
LLVDLVGVDSLRFFITPNRGVVDGDTGCLGGTHEQAEREGIC